MCIRDSSHRRRAKSPLGTVLIINLLGKGLAPRACMGDGGSIWWAPVTKLCPSEIVVKTQSTVNLWTKKSIQRVTFQLEKSLSSGPSLKRENRVSNFDFPPVPLPLTFPPRSGRLGQSFRVRSRTTKRRHAAMIHPLTQVATKCIPRKFNSPNLKFFAFGGWLLFSARTSRLKRPIAKNTRWTLLKLSGNSYWTIGPFAVPVSQPLWWLNHNIFENSVRTEWITVRPRKPWTLEISSECLLCYDQSQQRSGHANWPQNHKLVRSVAQFWWTKV